MATRIRLRRVGRKGQAYFRIVIADSKSPRDGRFVAAIGHYNPKANPAVIDVNASGSCAWQAQASVDWIKITSGSGVSGSGIVSYTVMPGAGKARSGSIWIIAAAGGSPTKGKASQVVTQAK